MVQIRAQQIFWPRRAETDTPYLDEDANAGRARCPNAPRGTAGCSMVKIRAQQIFWPRRAETDTPYLDEDANAGRARCPQRAARNSQRTTLEIGRAAWRERGGNGGR